jgi:hypothetical protein
MSRDEMSGKVFCLSVDEIIEWYVAYVARGGILREPKPQSQIMPELLKDTDQTKT